MRAGPWLEASRGKPRELQWPAVVWAPRFCKRCGKGRFWEGVWPCLDPWDSVRLRTASTCWNVPGKHGPHGELFFHPDQEGARGFERGVARSRRVH